MNKVTAKPNANLFLLCDRSIHDLKDHKYIEYRDAWYRRPETFTTGAFPIHLDVEATNRCNLSCTFCDKLPLLTKKSMGDMNYGLFKKILDEGEENGLYSLKLSYRGEPLLHPLIVDMVLYAKKKGIIDIYFNTNGMLLDKNMALKLMDAGLDRISISVEGIDPEIFEKRRRGASFSSILYNIDTLINLRERKGLSWPKVRVQTVYLPELDVKTYTAFWRHHSDEVAAIDYKNSEHRKTGIIQKDWACPQLWQRMTVEWDGTVLGCNNDDLRRLSPGNIQKKFIYECWRHPIVLNARKLHKRGKSHMVEACDGCPWRTSQLNKINNEKE